MKASKNEIFRARIEDIFLGFSGPKHSIKVKRFGSYEYLIFLSWSFWLINTKPFIAIGKFSSDQGSNSDSHCYRTSILHELKNGHQFKLHQNILTLFTKSEKNPSGFGELPWNSSSYEGAIIEIKLLERLFLSDLRLKSIFRYLCIILYTNPKKFLFYF